MKKYSVEWKDYQMRNITMDESTRKYREAQFKEVSTEYSEYKTKIKIIKPDGETNWIDIENAEFEQIKKILTGRG
jgi:hypothetical protein